MLGRPQKRDGRYLSLFVRPDSFRCEASVFEARSRCPALLRQISNPIAATSAMAPAITAANGTRGVEPAGITNPPGINPRFTLCVRFSRFVQFTTVPMG